MKIKFFLFVYFLFLNSVCAQYNEILIEDCKNCTLKKRIAIDFDNFITISNVTQAEFERFVISNGYNTTTTEKFCCEANQNSTSEEIMGAGQYFNFTKCDNSFFVMWSGKSEMSGFKEIVNRLQDYFYQEENGVKEYRVLVGNQKYKIAISRKIDRSSQSNLAFEWFLMVKVN